MKQWYYIETMGCQMNKLDSELVENQLLDLGYQQTDDIKQAQVIIYNTCSVRQHAEDKVISKIGQLTRWHREQPEVVLAVIGCMAQRWGEELLDKYKQVDIVCGPGKLHRLSEMVQRARENRRDNRCAALDEAGEDECLERLDILPRKTNRVKPFQAFVRVMRGCNNYCSYCIVPYVRGPERSRPLENIVQEARRLIEEGVREITLLGQAVNKYRYISDGRTLGLADVLEAVHEINGLQRLRFVTSYPRNFDEKILQSMAHLEKVCPYLHIPAQSGSNRILRAMNRRYTVEKYLELIEKARSIVTGLTVAGDFIVGFPGETDEDFQATVDLMRKVRYKNCFIFRYSPRPGTQADDNLADDVPIEVKQQRNQDLLDLQNEISNEDNQQFIGQSVEVLVEGPSKNPHLNEKQASEQLENDQKKPVMQMVGRTGGDHIVVFKGPESQIGEIVNVKVNRASALTLFGEDIIGC